MFWSALLSQKAIPGMRQSSRSTSLLRYHVLHASTGPLGSDDDAPLPVPRLKELVLIRHGESEGNVARQKSLQGDDSLFYGEFKNRHSSNWRLTDRGRQQALAAGEWLRENNLVHFDRYFVSEYLRAMETASRLQLPDAKWYAEMLLRERDWGQMDLMSEQERISTMQHELQRRDLDRFYYAPPGGESLAAVAQRVDRLFCSLNRECNAKKAIVVCHGEVIWAMRTRLERMSQDTFRELQDSGRMVDQIHNGHILHYTRTDPFTGEVAPSFSYMRSVCPWNEKLSPKGWIKIERPVYDNEMLLAIAERVPRMIVSEEYIEETYKRAKSSFMIPKAARAEQSITSSIAMNTLMASTSQNAPSDVKPMYNSAKKALDLKKVLVVNKMTRFEHECELHGNSGDALRKQMSMRGFVYDRLKASHDHHVEALEDITSTLKQHSIQVDVISADRLNHEAVNSADMVFSAGGDGTFLKAASFVNTPIPVAGLNTDPVRSEGKLCCYAVDQVCNRFSTVLERLLEGKFNWRLRQRIRVGMVNQDGFWYELPRYALNEVFIAESDASRPSHYNIGVDQHQRESQRSSGIIVCTGTGSSAWYYSACQMYREQVAKVLQAMHHTHTNETVTELTELFNKESVYSEDSVDLGYIVREPIINETFGDIRFRRGKARRVSMRSLGWDMRVTLDGIYSVPLDYGVQAVMKVCDEPKYVLRTVDFSDSYGETSKESYWCSLLSPSIKSKLSTDTKVSEPALEMPLDAQEKSQEGLDQQLKCLKYELELLSSTSDRISQLLAVLTEEQRQLLYAKKRLQSSVKAGQQTHSTRLIRIRDEQKIRMQIAQEKAIMQSQNLAKLRESQLQVRLETNESESDVSGLLEQEFEM